MIFYPIFGWNFRKFGQISSVHNWDRISSVHFLLQNWSELVFRNLSGTFMSKNWDEIRSVYCWDEIKIQFFIEFLSRKASKTQNDLFLCPKPKSLEIFRFDNFFFFFHFSRTMTNTSTIPSIRSDTTQKSKMSTASKSWTLKAKR